VSKFVSANFEENVQFRKFHHRFSLLRFFARSYISWDAHGIISHLRKKSRVFRDSCVEHVTRSTTSGQGVQGRQRFLDEDGILLAHRSITAAEDKIVKESQLA
jgi:hypothetical protein